MCDYRFFHILKTLILEPGSSDLVCIKAAKVKGTTVSRFVSPLYHLVKFIIRKIFRSILVGAKVPVVQPGCECWLQRGLCQLLEGGQSLTSQQSAHKVTALFKETEIHLYILQITDLVNGAQRKCFIMVCLMKYISVLGVFLAKSIHMPWGWQMWYSNARIWTDCVFQNQNALVLSFFYSQYNARFWLDHSNLLSPSINTPWQHVVTGTLEELRMLQMVLTED